MQGATTRLSRMLLPSKTTKFMEMPWSRSTNLKKHQLLTKKLMKKNLIMSPSFEI